MPEIVETSPSNLLLDAENPRLPQPNTGQRDVLRSLAGHQGRKLVRLAKDIVDAGLNPADLMIVMPFSPSSGRYVVLEGNRRLVALRGLENPDVLAGAVAPAILSQLRVLSKQYQIAPVEELSCVLVKDREEARHWIELRHTGENEGAGIVKWGSEDMARFRARGNLPIHVQALEFLESKGLLTPEERRDVPATSLRRLLGTPHVRSAVGVGLQKGKLQLHADEGKVAKALEHVARDLAYGKTSVKDIYTEKQRVAYANKIPAKLRIKGKPKSGGDLLHGGDSKASAAKSGKPRKPVKQRDILIPGDCVLQITAQRILDIEDELRRLSLKRYTNAVSVLFRVFIELSADAYIDEQGLSVAEKADLRQKLEAVVVDLLKRTKLSKQQAVPVRRACQKNSFLAPSVTLLHQFIHNLNVFPIASELRAQWDSLQPFMVAIWSP